MAPLRTLLPTQPVSADAAVPSETSTNDVGAPQVPRDTSPTWELELLISGAVIFALLQLPPLLDSARDWLEPRLSIALAAVLAVLASYGRAILYALITTFVLHLSGRAYWVALVGLDSVFPAGVAWDKLKIGPVSKQLYQERLPRLQALIARTDNVCSMMFAVGFLAAFFFGFAILMMGVIILVTLGISQGLLGGRYMVRVFLGMAALVFGLPLLAATVDKLGAGRLAPGGLPARALRGLAALNYRTSLVGVYGPIALTLFSNVRKTVIYPIFYLFFFGLLGIVFMEDRFREDGGSLDSYAFVPDAPGAYGVNGLHYEDQRSGRGVYATVPFVQSDVIREPYVRLFIPYVPSRHNEALAAGCPGAAPDGSPPGDTTLTVDERRAAATLACLTRIHRVRVNGADRPDVELRFHVHPESEMKGMLAYIPVAGLPRGRNVLSIGRPPSPVNPITGVRRPTGPPYAIPFWL